MEWMKNVSKEDAKKLVSWWMKHDPKHVYDYIKNWWDNLYTVRRL